MNAPNAAAPDLDLDGTIVALARSIAALDPGDLAALRRPVPPGDIAPAAFWRLWARLDLGRQRGTAEAWGRLAQAIAILTQTGDDDRKPSAHDGSLSLGRALHEAGYSELRFARLLATHGETRRDLVLRACRMLARAGVRFDVRQLGRLTLFDKTPVLQRLARDYYGALDAANRTEGDADNA